MPETAASYQRPTSPTIAALLAVVTWAGVAVLALVVAAELVFFAIHAFQVLRFPYPLDYGEGPLLAQVNLLRAGTPIWHLYADPGAPPYAVVNYPPMYHLAALMLAFVTGDALLAGRLVSLFSALASVVALWRLADTRYPIPRLLSLLVGLAFLGLPIVREWAVLMRVDMLGVCLGLWGLVIVRRRFGQSSVLWAALPLALSLLVKPSLLAAPMAAFLWLLFRDWKRALALGLLTGAIGGAIVGLLQWASGGWFVFHVLTANANAWQFLLAHDFWQSQLRIVWPLFVPAALLALGVVVRRSRRNDTVQMQYLAAPSTNGKPCLTHLLPLYYTLFGAITAFGIGKVGAYANYFLELYAGLIWIAAGLGFWVLGFGFWNVQVQNPKSKIQNIISAVVVVAALLRYYPLWSETYLAPYGLIERANPPRVAFGGYGIWRDLARERAVLAALGRINAALVAQIQTAGAPIFTDIPGIAAEAGQLTRLQAFEHRQLLDIGRWDERPLLRDLANGRVPLIALDYLGNWLSPEMIALIAHRYGQDGSFGSYDTYRPIELGRPSAADMRFPGGPRLVGYRLGQPAGRALYQPGELLLVTLELRRDQNAADDYEVLTQLADQRGNVLLETTRPLLYGALPPRDWANETVQHLQPIALPPELPPGDYHLLVSLRAGGQALAVPRALAPIVVEPATGRLLGERGYFVPEPLLAAWRAAGDYDGPGDPIMPATPFHGFTLQCFARACVRLSGTTVERLPLGELIMLGDTSPPVGASGEGAGQSSAETGQFLRGSFLDFWNANGGVEAFGPPISAELRRGDRVVQYTRYARLERPVEGGEVRLGNLGDEFLQLPGGGPYRWP